MKTVLNISMVAHLWAHQSQPHARNGSNSFSFDGPVIYSYSTPIAMIHETRRGRVVLVTSERYSTTTSSQHMPEVRRAYRGVIAKTFSVPHVAAHGVIEQTANVAHLVEEYKALAGRILRAHYLYTDTRDAITESLTSAATIVSNYCDTFKLGAPVLDVPDDVRVIWGKRQARELRAKDPKVVAARERAKTTADHRREQKEIRERAERYEREKDYRAEFRAGAHRYVRDKNGGALLRFDAADDMIRTSQGAEIPAEHARKAFPLIQRIAAAQSTALHAWTPGAHAVHLGAFALNEVRADGSIRVGCHTIHWPEIEACARALGLLV